MLAARHGGSGIELDVPELGNRLEHIVWTLGIQQLRCNRDLSRPFAAESNHEVKP